MVTQNKAHLHGLLIILITAVFGIIGMYNPWISLVLALGIFVAAVPLVNPFWSLGALIIAYPFGYTYWFDYTVGGIPGLKVTNLLPLFVIYAFFLYKRGEFRLNRKEWFFVGGLVFLLVVGAIRSLPHLAMINWAAGLDMGPEKYILSKVIKPILFLLPLVVIVWYVDDEKGVRKIVNYLNAGLFVLSVTILSLYIFSVADKGNFYAARDTFSLFFRMHGNDIVNFYILGYPVLLAALIFRKSTPLAVNLILCLAAVALLYSRTGYVAILLSTLMLTSFANKKKIIPLAVAVGALLVILLPETVTERAVTGFDTANTNQIMAGRVENIWAPLLEEYAEDPRKLIFGEGLQAMVYSEAYRRGRVLEVGHAHNMYLDALFEVGLLGLSFLLFSFLFLLRRFAKAIRGGGERYEVQILKGVTVAVLAFMFCGLTGRGFFPSLPNSYLWLLFGLGLVLVKMIKAERADHA